MDVSFFFPYLSPSGVSSLFARLAHTIAEQPGSHVRLIDFKGGAMARTLTPASKVELVEYGRDREVVIGPDETLVLQAEAPGKFRRQLKVHPAAKLILWQLHPHNLVPAVFPLIGQQDWWLRHPRAYRRVLGLIYPRQKRNIQEYVALAARCESLFFQDKPGLQATETYLGCSISNPILLPVPVPVSTQPQRTGRTNGDELHVAWIGRLYDFKIHILVHTLWRFIDHARNTGRQIIFHVVGDGPKSSELDQFGTGLGGLKLIKHGDLTPADLHRLLIERVDLVTAMGTAALESAALGLPVILLDLSYRAVPRDYQFRWLSDAKGFELGHTITAADCDAKEDSFPKLITAVAGDYATVARRSFDYVKLYHSLESVATRFLELAGCAKLSYGEIPKRLWRKTWVRQVYERVRY